MGLLFHPACLAAMVAGLRVAERTLHRWRAASPPGPGISVRNAIQAITGMGGLMMALISKRHRHLCGQAGCGNEGNGYGIWCHGAER
jgi:hypothetical protein